MIKLYSEDGERFRFDTVDELVDACELKPGDTYYEAEARPVDVGMLFSVDEILETAEDRLYVALDEVAESGLGEVSEMAKDELAGILRHWFRKYTNARKYLEIVSEPKELIL